MVKDNFEKELRAEIEIIEKKVNDDAIDATEAALKMMIQISPIWAGEYSANHAVFIEGKGIGKKMLSKGIVMGWKGWGSDFLNRNEIPPSMPKAAAGEWRASAIIKAVETIAVLRSYDYTLFNAIRIENLSGYANSVEYGIPPVKKPHSVYQRGTLRAQAALKD